MNSPGALLISSLLAFSSFGSAIVLAQDMMGLDVTSDAFTKSEMTRADRQQGCREDDKTRVRESYVGSMRLWPDACCDFR